MIRRLLLMLGIVLFITTAICAATLGTTTVKLDGRLVRSHETNLGDFVADAIRHLTCADIAVIPASAFRENDQGEGSIVNAGDVDEQTLREVLTSPNDPIVMLTLTPAVLRNMLERAVAEAPGPNVAFLQISGLTVIYDSALTPRVVGMMLGDKALSFTDDKTPLRVAMPRELGMGGTGYHRVFPTEAISTQVTTEHAVFDAIKAEFTRQKGTVSPTIDGRLLDTAAQ